MTELELKALWQTTNQKLEESFVLSRKNLEDITRIKVHNFLGSMKPIKMFTLLVGILWVGIGATALSSIYVNAFSEANKFFLFSASLQVLLTAIALFIYVYQLIKIFGIELTDTILETQRKMAQLKITSLWSARILFLQLPVWTTFWWNETILTEWNLLQWLIVMITTGSFTFLAFWLFLNIKYENRNKKWFQLIFNGKEWTPLMKAMELLEQLDEFKTETKVSCL
jgi:hypothetical protein